MDSTTIEYPHACQGSAIFLMGIRCWNEETGEKEEYLEVSPCRHCAEAREDAS